MKKLILLLSLVLIATLISFVSAAIDKDINGLTYDGGDFDDINCQLLGTAEWLGTEWVDSCQSSVSVLYTINNYPSSRVSVIIEQYEKDFENDILVESIEDLYDWDEFDTFDYSVIMEGIHLAYVTNGDFKQSMLFWKSENYVVSIIVDELPMSYSDDPLIESVLDSYLSLYPLFSLVNAVCQDSDGGKNVLVYGKAEIEDVGGQGDWCDYRKGEGRIHEAYCVSDTEYSSELMDCPSEKPFCNKGQCASEKPQCVEDDGGKNVLVQGTTFPEGKGEDERGHTDYCRDATGQPIDKCSGADCSLREYFCVEGSDLNFYNDILCQSGCESGACTKIEPNEETGPIDISESEEGSKKEVKVVEAICNGCILNKICYPIGYRMEDSYCDNGDFSNEKEADDSCNNNFECKSNVCVSGECISEGLLRKILNWFKRLFG